MNKKEHYLIIISGPSGAGKSTLTHRLIQDPAYQLSVSCTTRKIRPGEQNGKDYYFLTRDVFEQKILENQFLEYAQYDGNYYGTLLSELDRILPSAHCLLDIDVQGAQSIREHPFLKAKTIFIFIEPPNLEEQVQRLKTRGNNPDFNLEVRLERARKEIQEKTKFDQVFVNQNLEDMIDAVKNYLKTQYSK